MTTVGWAGTGRMGAAMVGRLLAAGQPVTVWNRTRAKAEALAGTPGDGAAGPEVTVVAELRDLADRDVVFIMVTGDDELAQVAGELLAGPHRPGTLVDCSTVSATCSARIRADAAAQGVGFLAAPVSGNPIVVAGGGACVVASGPSDTFERARPQLEKIAKLVVRAGDAEESRLVKLCHNLYLGIMVQALAEVTSLAEKAGVPRAALVEFLGAAVVGSDWLRGRAGALVALDLTPTFTATMLRKDFDLGLAAARGEQVPMPVASAVRELIQTTVGHGRGDLDMLALYLTQAEHAGLHPTPIMPADPNPNPD